MMDKSCPTPEPFRAMLGNILFLTLLFFVAFISRYIFSPLMPVIKDELALTHGQAGSVFLFGSVGTLVASVCSGFVSSRLTHRGTLILSTFLVGVTLLALTFHSSLWVIRVAMLVLGMAAGLGLPSNVATITALVNRQDWGKALAVQQLAPPLSLVLGPLLAVALLAILSWQMVMACLGVFALVVSFAFMRFGKVGGFPGDAPSLSLAKVILSRKSFWVMIILFAFAMGGQVGIYAMLPLYLVTEHGMADEFANTLLGLSQISGLFMTFFAGWMTDRIGEKRAIFSVLLVSGIATILLGTLSGAWLVFVVFLQPALIVCYFPAGFAALSRIVQPNMRSLASAWAPPMAFVIGGGLFPTALGYIGQSYTFGLGISIAGWIIVLGSALVFLLTLLEKLEDGC
jgi:NNP family nitrate/nitrite transporter-like MFS transporter